MALLEGRRWVGDEAKDEWDAQARAEAEVNSYNQVELTVMIRYGAGSGTRAVRMTPEQADALGLSLIRSAQKVRQINGYAE